MDEREQEESEEEAFEEESKHEMMIVKEQLDIKRLAA